MKRHSSSSSSSRSNPPSNEDRQSREFPIGESRQFSINSKDAKPYGHNGTRKSDMYFDVPNFITNHSDTDHIVLKVISASIPNVFYNIPVDDKVTFTYSTVNGAIAPLTVELPVPAGFYDILTLINLLNNALTVPVNGVDFATFMGFTYSGTTSFVSIDIQDYNDSTWSFQKSLTLSSMGFEFDENSLFGINYTSGTLFAYKASDMPRLISVTNIFIESPQIPTLNYSTETKSSFLVNIPITGDFGYTAQYQFQNTNGILIPNNLYVDVLQINVRDQNGELVDFQNNNWSIMFEVSYHRMSVPKVESLTEALRNLLLQAKEMEDDPTYKRVYTPLKSVLIPGANVLRPFLIVSKEGTGSL